jgi:thiamine-monophosphate kinase
VSAVLRRHLDHVAACTALLAGGDDYELCFTAPGTARERIMRAGRRARVPVTRIGDVRRHRAGTPRLIVRAPDGAALRVVRGGYDHFA